MKLMLPALLVLLTVGCGSAPSRSGDSNSPSGPQIVTDDSKILEQLDERPMSEESIEDLLAAEFAGYRGDSARLVELYLKAARETGDPRILARTVQLAIEMGDLDRAMQAAVLWHERQPDNFDATILAAQMLARSGEAEAAWLIAEQTRSSRLIRLIATETVSTQNPQQVIWLGQQIEQFSANRAPDTELFLAQAILLNFLEQTEQAATLARRALILDSRNLSAVMLLTQILVTLERADEAVLILEDWLLSNWDSLENRAALLSGYLEMDRNLADASLSRMYRLHPDSEELLLVLAEIKLNTRQLEAAEALYLKVVDYPEHADLGNLQLGRIAHFHAEVDLAYSYYSKVPLGVYYQYAQDQIVVLLAGFHRMDQLLAYFAEQRKNHPDQIEELFVAQSQVLNSLNEDDLALNFLNQALQNFPDNLELRYNRSLVAERLDRLDISEIDLRHIIGLDGTNSNALNALGYTLTNRTDRHAEAYLLIEEALELDPDSAAIQDSMGWVLHKMGKNEEALPYLEEAQSQFYDPEVISHHAEVLWRLGRVDEALDMLGVAMLEFPGNQLLNEIRQRILDDLNNS